jgi:hypothetical protein
VTSAKERKQGIKKSHIQESVAVFCSIAADKKLYGIIWLVLMEK